MQVNLDSFKRFGLYIIVFLIFFLTIASRIVVRFILLSTRPQLWMTVFQETGYRGVLGFSIFITRIYQLVLPFYIILALALGVIAALSRYRTYEYTYTKLFFLGILDMLAALLGDIFYLVLEYSKTWVSFFGFNKLGEFLVSTVYLAIVPSVFILLSEFVFVLVLYLRSLSFLKHFSAIQTWIIGLYKRFGLYIIVFLIFFLTIASRIVVRFLLLNVKISRGPVYVIGIPGFAIYISRIYQLGLPIYIILAIILGITATHIRYRSNELTHTKLFLLGILDMLAALLGDILYLVLEYSKTWFSRFGFSKLVEFLGIMMPFALNKRLSTEGAGLTLFIKVPLPLILSLVLLLSELSIIVLIKSSSYSRYLNRIKASIPYHVVYFLLCDVYFHIYKMIKRDPSSAPILIFIVSLIMSAVISLINTSIANEIITYTFFLLLFGVLWKFIILIREGDDDKVDTSIQE